MEASKTSYNVSTTRTYKTNNIRTHDIHRHQYCDNIKMLMIWIGMCCVNGDDLNTDEAYHITVLPYFLGTEMHTYMDILHKD